MAHIAIDARIINSSTGRYIERLLHFLQQVDSHNTYSILVRKKDQDFWHPTAKNFSVIVADFDLYSFAEQLGFKRFLDKLKPDLVHFCMPQQPVLYKGTSVTTFHDLTLLKTYNSDKNWLSYHAKQIVARRVFKRVAHTSEHIITTSQFTQKELVEYTHIPVEKTSVIYEAADVTTTVTKSYKVPFKKYLLYVGQQSDYKNIRRLSEAHQQLLQRYPHIGLVLVGKLNKSALINQTFFAQKGYKNILFTDFIEDDQLNWLYTHTAAYIFPSLMEGFGLPGLEAMAHGAPVISSNATCLPEIYEQAATYFDPLNVSDITRAITEVLGNEPMRLALIKAGYKQVKKYSWKKMAQQTLAVYEEVLTSSLERS